MCMCLCVCDNRFVYFLQTKMIFFLKKKPSQLTIPQIREKLRRKSNVEFSFKNKKSILKIRIPIEIRISQNLLQQSQITLHIFVVVLSQINYSYILRIKFQFYLLLLFFLSFLFKMMILSVLLDQNEARALPHKKMNEIRQNRIQRLIEIS